MAFVEVAVNSGLPHRSSFSYAVPEGLSLQPGDGVYVPFGRRRLQGIVMQAVTVPAFADPKPVEAQIGDRPVIAPERVELARWLSDYYLSPLFAAVALMLPPGFQRKPLTYYEPLAAAPELDRLRLAPRQNAVMSLLAACGRSEAAELQRDAKLPGLTTALSQLVQRGLVRRSYALAPPRVRAKTIRYVELTATPDAAQAAIEAFAARRQRRLAKALSLLISEGRLAASELRRRSGAGLRLLVPLAEAGLIAVRDEPVERDPLAGRRFEPRPAPPLTPEQAAAFAPVAAAIADGEQRAFLLHGVTGSGKTEVYLRALEETLRRGRRAIVLVPEIALTPQTVRRFAERFPGRVAVLHSGLSQGELFDQWHGVRDGRYAVVVGSRSAVFAPQPDLGLIVIDEEHEWTYKQHDQAPRYDAREAAERLAALTGSVLILGSATPDVVSYQRALWGRYDLLQLRERVRPVLAGRPASGPSRLATTPDGPSAAREAPLAVVSSEALPPVEVIDMREELKGGNRRVFSRALQFGLFKTLERGEQAILFLNRRGTAGFLQCRDCGFVPRCSACAIALSYHRYLGPRRRNGDSAPDGAGGAPEERLLCHQCNRGRRLYAACPMCGSARLRPMGLGVEAVEDALAELLPGARPLRWDRDVTQGRNAHEQILARFLAGEADVLIGTQMVAKGLDLPSVTLVGVISADIGLHVPDYRSAERTFQLLTQVAGRAGRVTPADGSAPPGRVIVQTYTPDSYAVVAAAGHDYASFFAQEIDLRRDEAYPPFVRLALLVYSHTNEDYGRRQAERLAETLRSEASRRGLPGVEVLGPAPPYVPKWHGRHRWQVTLRSPDPAELLREVTLAEGWTLDIDPASLA